MRRRILTILLAALVVVIVVPLGAALTFDRRAPMHRQVLATEAFVPASTVQPAGPMAEAGTLLLTGGLLIGLAIVVRRAG